MYGQSRCRETVIQAPRHEIIKGLNMDALQRLNTAHRLMPYVHDNYLCVHLPFRELCRGRMVSRDFVRLWNRYVEAK